LAFWGSDFEEAAIQVILPEHYLKFLHWRGTAKRLDLDSNTLSRASKRYDALGSQVCEQREIGVLMDRSRA
jgi:hypothetical protein